MYSIAASPGHFPDAGSHPATAAQEAEEAAQ
jgi:hypothetical protein